MSDFSPYMIESEVIHFFLREIQLHVFAVGFLVCFLVCVFFFFFPGFLNSLESLNVNKIYLCFLNPPASIPLPPPPPPKWAVTLFLAISACFIRNNYSIRANNYICVCFSLGFFFNTKDRFVFNETPSTGKQRFEHCFKRKICHKLLECS